ncbi:unnamed protein product [Moneuplotes crassus]|uniref:Uncharacterized protein n=1 Tax=Euplotes crassus TaxID=5936 RepID=A0AAD1XCM4_EUPCR|nr:unnamed protein product [Moneuplotes crassus]
MLVRPSPKHPSGSYSRAGRRIKTFSVKYKPQGSKSKPVSENVSDDSYEDEYSDLQKDKLQFDDMGLLLEDEQNVKAELSDQASKAKETRKERKQRLRREELKNCTPAFKSIGRDGKIKHPQTPDIGKYSPNYDASKPVRMTNFGKRSARDTLSYFYKSDHQRDSRVCDRLMRSLQNRKARVEIINKIFRKRNSTSNHNEGRVYRFTEKFIKNKLKDVHSKDKNEGDNKTIDEYRNRSGSQTFLDLRTGADHASGNLKIHQMRRQTTQSFDLLTPMKVRAKVKTGDSTTKVMIDPKLLGQNKRIIKPTFSSTSFCEKESRQISERDKVKKSQPKLKIKKKRQISNEKKFKTPNKFAITKAARFYSPAPRVHIQSVKMAKQMARDTNSFLEIPTYCANDYSINLDTVMGKLNRGMINFKKQTKRGEFNSFYKKFSAPEQYNLESISSAYDKLGYIGSNVPKAKLTFE